MSIYDKIRRMVGKETYDEKMYKLLNTERFNQERYETTDKGEEMSLIKQSILGWWKPRFLLDHRTKCAYEFMDAGEVLVSVKDEDIDWKSLDNLPGNLIQRVQDRDGHFRPWSMVSMMASPKYNGKSIPMAAITWTMTVSE